MPLRNGGNETVDGGAGAAIDCPGFFSHQIISVKIMSLKIARSTILDPDAMSANWESGAPVFGDLSLSNISCTADLPCPSVRPGKEPLGTVRDELERECAASNVEERRLDHRLRR